MTASKTSKINYTSIAIGAIGLLTAAFQYLEKVEERRGKEQERIAKEAANDTIGMIVAEHREFIKKEKEKNEKFDKLLALLDSL